MKTFLSGIAAIALAGALVTPAVAQDASIHIHGGSVGFIVGVGGQSILGHQLPGDSACEWLIDTTLDINLCEFVELQLRIGAQFSAFAGQIGMFESGVTAAWFGLVPAVVIGGGATLLVALLWMRWFPALRRIDRFPGH